MIENLWENPFDSNNKQWHGTRESLKFFFVEDGEILVTKPKRKSKKLIGEDWRVEPTRSKSTIRLELTKKKMKQKNEWMDRELWWATLFRSIESSIKRSQCERNQENRKKTFLWTSSGNSNTKLLKEEEDVEEDFVRNCQKEKKNEMFGTKKKKKVMVIETKKKEKKNPNESRIN